MDHIIGKLVVKMFINQKPADDNGRMYGRWVTLLSQYGLTHEEAKQEAFNFKENNPHVNRQWVSVEWKPNSEHIFL